MPPTNRPLTDLRTVKVADVYKGDIRAARIERVDNAIAFTYLPEYLAGDGHAVATTLPLQEQPVITTGGAVPAFFAGLLPEGRRLTALRRAVKTSADDDLSLLLAVGADTIGDVRVLPHGYDPAEAPETAVQIGDPRELDFRALLADTGIIDRSGIAGVQDKVSARMISVPVAQAGRRYILKLTPPEFPAVVENEHYFLRVARRSGLNVVDAQLLRDRNGVAGLLVERFDRSINADGTVVRHAVEDGGQLLGLYPADKYNVSTEAVAERIGQACAAQAVAMRDVFRQVCFAWLTGNGDVHAKNLSVMQRDSEWRVTPAYDLPSTLPYQDTTMALPVNGRVDGLSRRRLVAFAASLGLSEALAVRVLDEVLEGTSGVIGELEQQVLPFDARRIRDTVRSLAARRRLVQG